MQFQFGIIGFPLVQSFSQTYFQKKFDTLNIADTHQYLQFSIEDIGLLTQIISTHPNLVGLNVTMPHKQNILKYVNEVHETAAACGAANCLHFKNGSIKAYNTDVVGFEVSLQPLLLEQHKAALVLGTGGASKAVCFVLQKLGIDITLVSRFKLANTLLYTDIDQSVLQQHQLIINCSPAGMAPFQDSFPEIPYHFLTPSHLLYDLVYKPELTLFMQKGQAFGAQVKNGFEMLELQAEAGWSIWNS